MGMHTGDLKRRHYKTFENCDGYRRYKRGRLCYTAGQRTGPPTGAPGVGSQCSAPPRWYHCRPQLVRPQGRGRRQGLHGSRGRCYLRHRVARGLTPQRVLQQVTRHWPGQTRSRCRRGVPPSSLPDPNPRPQAHTHTNTYTDMIQTRSSRGIGVQAERWSASGCMAGARACQDGTCQCASQMGAGVVCVYVCGGVRLRTY